MSFLGKLGKFALKAAPIAAMAIPGVGPLASMAIGAGTSALSKKLEGGSWKDAALAGGIGGATGYVGGKGLGPADPTKFLKGDVANVASKATGNSGFLSKLGSVAKQTGTSILGGGRPVMSDDPSQGGITGMGGGVGTQNTNEGFLNSLRGLLGGGGTGTRGAIDTLTGKDPLQGNASQMGGQLGQQANPNHMGLGPSYDPNNPNLADAITAGQRDSQRRMQPRRFRPQMYGMAQ